MTGSSLIAAGLRAPALLDGGNPSGPAADSDSDCEAASASGPGSPEANLPPAGFFLPDLGPCRHRPVLLVLLFDNSPSVTDGGDIVGNRFGEAAIALAHCQRRCRCGRELVAVRTFDRHTSADVGPVQLSGAGWPQVARALAVPPEVGQGSSRLRPALRDAERMAREHPLHQTVLVVFSDFQLTDLLPELALERLCRFPGRVHAIVLAAEPPRPLVAGSAAVRQITPASAPGDVARAVIAALVDDDLEDLADLAGLDRTSAREPAR